MASPRVFLEKNGSDYFSEVFSTTRYETIRVVIGLACSRGWTLYYLDVNTAFLNGPLEELVFVTQPPGFVIKGKEDMVYKLNNALYRLKQAARAWNMRINGFFKQQGFKKCSVEHGIYERKHGDKNTPCLPLFR